MEFTEVTEWNYQTNHQTKDNVGLIDFQTISRGANSIKERIETLKADGYKYAIVDTIRNDDFDIICNGVKDLPFLTGGSGIALGLPKIYKDRGLLSASNFEIPKILIMIMPIVKPKI